MKKSGKPAVDAKGNRMGTSMTKSPQLKSGTKVKAPKKSKAKC